MFDHLIQLDQHLFHIINHDLTNPFFDWLMPHLRDAKFWIPLYLLIIGFCTWRYKTTGLIIIALMAMSAGFADLTSARIYKPAVHRLRPCQDSVISKTDILRVPCGTGLSFPSTHATDHFAMAFFIIMLFHKKWRWIWLWAILWAASICFAQVYVGVHYPIDVFCGALYGCLVGWGFAWVFSKLRPGFNKVSMPQ